jgi:hypothetical protein
MQYFAVFFRKNAVFCSKIVKKSIFFEFFIVVLLEFEDQIPQNEDVILLGLVSVIATIFKKKVLKFFASSPNNYLN